MESNNKKSESQVMWEPGLFGKTNIDIFREQINNEYNVDLRDYWQLHEWSIRNYDHFWGHFWKFSNIIYSTPYNTVIDTNKRIDEIPEWFSGAKLNYAENILERACNQSDTKVAFYVTGESRSVEKVTFGQLRKRVTCLVSAMLNMGITSGDRIVGYLPNGRDAVEAYLACSAIGAIWSSTSPDFGVSGVLERFRQIQPKLIFSTNAVIYNGKRHDHLQKLSQLVESVDGVLKVIISPLHESEGSSLSFDNIANSCTLQQFLSTADPGYQLKYSQLPFNHPLCILFSSGTTGEPKCLVHSIGGTLIKHLEEHILQGNMGSNDIIMYYTTTGWMMWNWLVSALATGASIVLYDGSPFHPTPNTIWDLTDQIGVTIMGTSAKGLQAMQEMGVKPKITHKLNSLHTILSTGSPLKPQSFDYVYNDIKSNVLLGSITGGSDIIACFAGQNPTIAVNRGEIQSIHLAIDVQCWNDEGIPVKGEEGELVCTKPFPSMPTMLWNDPDGKKYKKAYFSHFPGVWTHGDFCMINPDTNGILMLGRSDGTLNPNGVRFGSAEIYNIVECYKEVKDSVCVSQFNASGEERVVLFLKLESGYKLSQQLIDTIKSDIRTKLSPRHVPSVILEVADIPYTINGKKVEVAVKLVIGGKQVSNKNALINPEALKLYQNLPQLDNY